MSHACVRLGAAVLLAAVVAGCAGDPGIAARTREKSAVYAALTPREKRHIDKGAIALGYTPDMVYLALGHPSSTRPVDATGGRGELWIYLNFYPPLDARHVRRAPYTTESIYPPPRTDPSAQVRGGYGADAIQFDMGINPPATTTGAPQGGPMVPADLKSYPLFVLFQQGKVTKFGMRPS